MPHKMLLADDSITIQKVVGIIFANDDFELTIVDNGNAAVAKANELVPDVMLVDALMPGKNGYEVCREIRSTPSLAHIPLLLMTGVFEPFDEAKAKESGADDFISKPFESQQLIEKVKSLVETGKQRRTAAPQGAVAALSVQTPPPAQEPPAAPAAAAAAASFAPAAPEWASEEVFEATPEDDLWGTVELGSEAEEVTVGEEVAEEIFSFGEEVEPAVAAAPAAPAAVPAPVAEDAFSFEPEPFAVPVEEQTWGGEEFSFEDVTAEEEVVPASAAAPVFAAPAEEEFVFEDEPEVAPGSVGPAAAEPAAAVVPSAAEAAPQPPAAPAAGAAQPLSLSDEQLAAAISRISREVIERIVWEVVPDLAETMIREEIRRIKERV